MVTVCPWIYQRVLTPFLPRTWRSFVDKLWSVSQVSFLQRHSRILINCTCKTHICRYDNLSSDRARLAIYLVINKHPSFFSRTFVSFQIIAIREKGTHLTYFWQASKNIFLQIYVKHIRNTINKNEWINYDKLFKKEMIKNY